MLNLVAYSTDTDSDEEESEPRKKLPRLSPTIETPQKCKSTLPAANMLLGKLQTKAKDDDDEDYDNSAKHEGRIRSFKHVRGNWASYVCIPVDYELLEDCQTQIIDLLAPVCSDAASLQRINEPHISLTRTFVLQYHLIDSYVQSLKLALSNSACFSATLSRLKIYTNEEKTRTFVALEIDPGYSEKLKDLLAKIDGVMTEHRLPKFYKEPSFHVSFLWCLGDQVEFLQKELRSMQDLLDTYIAENQTLELDIELLQCKSGNKQFLFELK